MSEFEADQERLAFPCDLAPVIGLSKNEIAFLKRKGCPFYGRKTTVRWVREALRELWQSADAYIPHLDQECVTRWRKIAGLEAAK